jgi:hypothetical protein
MNERAQASTFVTVLGWIVAIFAGFATLGGLAQSAIITAMMPMPPLTDMEAAQMPGVMRFVFGNLKTVVYAMTAADLLAVVSAIGLLKRKEWARITMVVLFAIAAVATAAMAILQLTIMGDLFGGADVPNDARAMMSVMRITAGLFAVILIAAFVWIAVRLNSPAIRAEFH